MNDQTNYCDCGEEMDNDCFGNERCPVCDPPCPGCYDGGMDGQNDDEEEEQGEGEPTEDDLITEDYRHFYQYGKLALTLSSDDLTTEEMWEELREYMDEQQFWPSVWSISDHGNSCLMTPPEGMTFGN